MCAYFRARTGEDVADDRGWEVEVEDNRGLREIVGVAAAAGPAVAVAVAFVFTFAFAFAFALSAASVRLRCDATSGSTAERVSEAGGSTTSDANDIPCEAYEACGGRVPPDGTSSSSSRP